MSRFAGDAMIVLWPDSEDSRLRDSGPRPIGQAGCGLWQWRAPELGAAPVAAKAVAQPTPQRDGSPGRRGLGGARGGAARRRRQRGGTRAAAAVAKKVIAKKAVAAKSVAQPPPQRHGPHGWRGLGGARGGVARTHRSAERLKDRLPTFIYDLVHGIVFKLHDRIYGDTETKFSALSIQ